MLIICPSCLADETCFYDPAGENFCTECGANLDGGEGGDVDADTGCADDHLPGTADDWRKPLQPQK